MQTGGLPTADEAIPDTETLLAAYIYFEDEKPRPQYACFADYMWQNARECGGIVLGAAAGITAGIIIGESSHAHGYVMQHAPDAARYAVDATLAVFSIPFPAAVGFVVANVSRMWI